MKTKHYILLALLGLTAFFAGLYVGTSLRSLPQCAVTETMVTMTDTIRVSEPEARSETVSGARRYALPVRDISGYNAGGEAERGCVAGVGGTAPAPLSVEDSAIVELEIIQRHYADSTYEAWVSGPVDPRLDSVRVMAPTTVITKMEWKPPKRWHIGPTVGVGCTRHGIEPFVGISINYSIFDF